MSHGSLVDHALAEEALTPLAQTGGQPNLHVFQTIIERTLKHYLIIIINKMQKLFGKASKHF